MPVAQSRITSLTLTLLAGIVLTACSSKPEPELKKGEKAIDVAAVVRQKMPASVKDREAWAQAIAKTFASQKLARRKRTSVRCWRWRSRSPTIRPTRRCRG
ncbi:outer membrane lipoprotein [Klebsiella michiganensis]|uniref:Outer membrane lipoprotein n=1 Tax=Klebsiella michiganensis TaxID=1134687 RepID=A0A7H4LYZ2_9ENTR|nr:outer membrane lipoprotein [Klebsiella michiganensis]